MSVKKQSVRVLIADDVFDSRQLLTRLLCQLINAETREASTGVVALSQFRTFQPHITFMDIDMPERDGLDILKEIRQTDTQSFIIVVSGLGRIDKVQQAIALGVDGFIVKPFSAQRIVDVLRKYAAKSETPDLLGME